MFLPLLPQLWVLWAPCRILHQVPRALCGANQSKTALSLILVRLSLAKAPQRGLSVYYSVVLSSFLVPIIQYVYICLHTHTGFIWFCFLLIVFWNRSYSIVQVSLGFTM